MGKHDCCKKKEKKCNDKVVIINQQCPPCPVPPPLRSLFQLGLEEPLTISVLGNTSTTTLIPFVFNLPSIPIDTYLLHGASSFGSGVSLLDGYWDISSNLSLIFSQSFEPPLLSSSSVIVTAEIVLNPSGLNETLIKETYTATPYAVATNGVSLFFSLADTRLQLDPEIIRLIFGSPRDVAVRLTIQNNIASTAITVVVDSTESVFRGNIVANL